MTMPVDAEVGAPQQIRSLTPLEGGIMGLLARREPLSGWDVYKQAQGSVAYFWPIGRSQIYAALPRLEKLGLIEGRDVPQVGKPDKRVFRLTADGRAVLARWITQGEEGSARDVFLLKLFFGAHTDRAALEARLRERRAEALRIIDELERGSDSPDLDDFFHRLTRDYGRLWGRCLADWCDDALSSLAALGRERSKR